MHVSQSLIIYTCTYPLIFLKTISVGSVFSLTLGGTHRWLLGALCTTAACSEVPSEISLPSTKSATLVTLYYEIHDKHECIKILVHTYTHISQVKTMHHNNYSRRYPRIQFLWKGDHYSILLMCVIMPIMHCTIMRITLCACARGKQSVVSSSLAQESRCRHPRDSKAHFCWSP